MKQNKSFHDFLIYNNWDACIEKNNHIYREAYVDYRMITPILQSGYFTAVSLQISILLAYLIFKLPKMVLNLFSLYVYGLRDNHFYLFGLKLKEFRKKVYRLYCYINETTII